MVGVSWCLRKTSARSTYPYSVYFAPFSLILVAYAYSIRAPGGRLDAGTSADNASPERPEPSPGGEGFFVSYADADGRRKEWRQGWGPRTTAPAVRERRHRAMRARAR